MPCSAANDANSLFTALLAGENFTMPAVDLDSTEFALPTSTNPVVVRLTNADVTAKVVDGTGAFDIFASGISAHLKNEYDNNRITGAEYTKAYTALMEAALTQSVQFVLNREQMYWQSQLVQAQAIAARVAILTAKVQLSQMQMEAKTSAANFALTKVKTLAGELETCAATYNLDVTLPKQTSLLHSQIGETNSKIGVNLEQRLKTIKETALTAEQINRTIKEIALVQEQIETQRGSTTDTRTDGSTIIGSIGKQVQLHTAQITSFERDAETKVMKLMVDMWATQKTIDEGLAAPSQFSNPDMDTVLMKLRTNTSLV